MRLDDTPPTGPGPLGIRAAIGCTTNTPWPAEFYVQTGTWAQRACSQHVADVMRRAHHEGAGPVLVYPERLDSPCYAADDPRLPADPVTGPLRQACREGAA
jgi:hypothetical protein